MEVIDVIDDLNSEGMQCSHLRWTYLGWLESLASWKNLLNTPPPYPIPTTPQNLRHSGAESAIEGQLRQSKIVEDDARNEDLNESRLNAGRALTEARQNL